MVASNPNSLLLTLPFSFRDQPTDDLAASRFEAGSLHGEGLPENSVRQLLASWQSSRHLVQRRRWHRVEFQQQIQLTPFDVSNGSTFGESRRVSGRDISRGGISFCHADPLPHSSVLLEFELEEGGIAHFVTRLRWCRFVRQGGYHSGGEFVRQLAAEHEAARLDWESLPPG